jgi:hypothetical protein
MLPFSCEMLWIPHCLDNRLTDGGEVSSLSDQLYSTRHKYSLLVLSVRGEVHP